MSAGPPPTVPGPTVPIDDFLAGSGPSGGERWEAIGAGIGLGGVVLAIGLVVLLAIVHRGPRREIRTLLTLAAGAGALMLVGGVIEVSGTARVLEVGWLDALRDGSASGAMMRLVGGVLVLLGLSDPAVPVDDAPDHAPDHASDRASDHASDAAPQRWTIGASSAFGVVGLAVGALSFAFDGHTTAEGPRAVHAIVNVVHVVAGSVWFGGTVGLAVVATLRRSRGGSIATMLGAFARLATGALVTVVAAGIGLAVIILDDVSDLTGTDWGRRLIVKVSAVGVAALLGAYHHLVVVPRSTADDSSVDRVARRTLPLEAAVLAVVVVVTALLARASIT